MFRFWKKSRAAKSWHALLLAGLMPIFSSCQKEMDGVHRSTENRETPIKSVLAEEIRWLTEERGYLHFPPDHLSEDSLTIDFQRFFNDAAKNGRTVAFHATLQDILDFNGKIVAEFGCGFGILGLVSQEGVILNLEIDETQEAALVKHWHSDSSPRFMKSFLGRVVIVVAKVDVVKRRRLLIEQGSFSDADAENYIENSTEYAAYGRLVETFESQVYSGLGESKR
jgi:hypothetical protein